MIDIWFLCSTLAFKKLLVSWRPVARLLVLARSTQARDVLAISVRISLCPLVGDGICFHNFLEASLNVGESRTLTVEALRVRESWRFKTERKKLDWKCTKFFCLSALLPRQRNTDLNNLRVHWLYTHHIQKAPCTRIICFFFSRRGCKWKLLICHAAAGGFLLVPEESERIIQLSSQAQLFYFGRFSFPPICLRASLIQGDGSPATHSVAGIFDNSDLLYLPHRGVTWFDSPKDDVQTTSEKLLQRFLFKFPFLEETESCKQIISRI